MVNIDPSLPDAAPVANTEQHCHSCDYNLTGLIETWCPECGRPINPIPIPEPRLSSIHVVCIVLQGLATIALALISAFAIHLYFANLKGGSLIFGPPDPKKFGVLVIIWVQLPLLILGIFFGAVGAAAKPFKTAWLAFIFIGVALILINALFAILHYFFE